MNKLPVTKPDATVKETMNIIDEHGLGVALVTDENNKLLGIVTDGDIRRSLLRGMSINERTEAVMNRNPVTAPAGSTKDEVFQIIRTNNIAGKLPIVDKEGRIVDMAILHHDISGEPFLSQKKVSGRPVHKILVVGGAGYLGSVLVRKLTERNYRVRVLDSMMYTKNSLKDIPAERCEVVTGDLLDVRTLLKSMRSMDAVVHLAAIVGDPASQNNPEETVQTNYLASKLLADICKFYQINKFLFASTCSVYGASESEEELTEKSGLNPLSLYAEMKLRSEQALLENMDENFSPTILRFSTLFGVSPRMRFDLAVNTMTAKAMLEGEISVYGGNQWRPFLHVADAAEAIIRCLEAPISKVRGKIYNVGAANIRIEDLGRQIRALISSARISTDPSKGDRRNYRVSSEKIRQELGFEPGLSIEDGIAEIKDFVEREMPRWKDAKYHNHLF